MSWTFDDADISTDLAKVRVLIGDVDTSDQLMSDEMISYFLTVDDNVFGAASLAAKSIQAKFARLADTTIEGVSVKYTQKAVAYGDLAADLASQALDNDLPNPSVFGISKDAIRTQRDDDDRVQERFYTDQFTNPPDGSLKVDGQDV